MRVIAKRTLRQFWEQARYADAKGPLEAWYAEALKSAWRTPQDVKGQFGTASVLKGSRVVFNVGGNKYRLVVWINYPYRVIYVRFIGTHAQYDRIDAQTV